MSPLGATIQAKYAYSNEIEEEAGGRSENGTATRCIFGGAGLCSWLQIYEPMYTNEVIPGHLTFQATTIVIRSGTCAPAS